MINIRYAEYDAIHKGDFFHDMPEGLDCWLILMTHSYAVFQIENEFVKCPPNSIFLYHPFQKIHYRACDSRFANDWMHFEIDDSFMDISILPKGLPINASDPAYIHKLFQLISMEHEKGDKYKGLVTEKLLQIMFYKLFEDCEPRNTIAMIHDVHDLKREIQSKPGLNWTLKMMAEELNISTGYLEHLYKGAFGVGCVEDVINNRIKLAKKYLRESDCSIAEIVPLCGYHSPEHFFRQFKKMTGITPKNYRKGTKQN